MHRSRLLEPSIEIVAQALPGAKNWANIKETVREPTVNQLHTEYTNTLLRVKTIEVEDGDGTPISILVCSGQIDPVVGNRRPLLDLSLTGLRLR